MLLIPAKDVPLYRRFADPATGQEFYRVPMVSAVLRVPVEAGAVMALDEECSFWTLGGDRLVVLLEAEPD